MRTCTHRRRRHLDRPDRRAASSSARPTTGRAPDCGAVVLFSGTVRDHAEGRDDVANLTYEAYEEQALPKLQAIADEMRARWPVVGRVALLHRLGRARARANRRCWWSCRRRIGRRPSSAARFGIDALKASVPIWKHEVWNGGSDWALGAQHLSIDGRRSMPSADRLDVRDRWSSLVVVLSLRRADRVDRRRAPPTSDRHARWRRQVPATHGRAVVRCPTGRDRPRPRRRRDEQGRTQAWRVTWRSTSGRRTRSST